MSLQMEIKAHREFALLPGAKVRPHAPDPAGQKAAISIFFRFCLLFAGCRSPLALNFKRYYSLLSTIKPYQRIFEGWGVVKAGRTQSNQKTDQIRFATHS